MLHIRLLNQWHFLITDVQQEATIYYDLHFIVTKFSFVGNFYKENKYLFKKIASLDITPDEISESWKELAKAVIIENELASHVIKKNVPWVVTIIMKVSLQIITHPLKDCKSSELLNT